MSNFWGCTLAKPEYFVPEVWRDQPAIWGDQILEKTQPLFHTQLSTPYQGLSEHFDPPKLMLDGTPSERMELPSSESHIDPFGCLSFFRFNFGEGFWPTIPHLLDLHSSTKVPSMGLGISQRPSWTVASENSPGLVFSPVLGLHWCTPV